MARILVHVEGFTERYFVRNHLQPHLAQFGHSADARVMGNARPLARRGGIVPWPSAAADIIRHLREDPAAFATTLVDYYGMPSTGRQAWPGRAGTGTAAESRSADLTEGMAAGIAKAMGTSFNRSRFIPYVTMHEFEGLLFSDPDRLAIGIGRRDLALQLNAISREFRTPEEINDSPATAPSKRILSLLPSYQKVLQGNAAMGTIGLATVRAACPIFDSWITALEHLPVS